MTVPWEMLLGTFTLNDPGGAVVLETASGLDMPDARKEVSPKLADHGSLIFAEFLTERVITITGRLVGNSPTERQQLRAALGAAFTPVDAPISLMIAMEDGSTRVAYVSPTRLAFPVDSEGVKVGAHFVGELTAADPRLYLGGPTQQRVWAPAPAVSPGLGFSAGFSWIFGGGASGQVRLINGGNLDTPPVVTIYGPVTNPLLINQDAGDTMSMQIVLGLGDHLTLDYAARTVVLNDTASRYSALVGGRWATLLPGGTQLQFVGSDITPDTYALATWRSAWSTV